MVESVPGASLLAPTDADALRILVSTDNHLGYEERDAVRGEDSFHSFAEVLSIARSENVDLLLLGGDLFHDNKPSRECLYRCMKLLRENCHAKGEPDRDLQLSSDSLDLLHGVESGTSIESALKASLPVFAVHGNHDDPVVGARLSLSPLDILQAAGLLNYWGTVPDSDEIRIRPLLLRKGRTKVALYGLGHVREERLYTTWQVEKRVFFEVPIEVDDECCQSEYFQLFVLHQNRERRGHAKAVTRDLLPEWLDLVIWGHEHPCRIALEGSQPAITQPGSAVATALTAGEAIPKHVGLLEIRGTSWRWTPIPLQTVRAFHYEDIRLTHSSHGVYRDAPALEQFLREHVEALLERLGREYDERQKQFGAQLLPDRLRAPLIRLRVEYEEGFSSLSPVRFGRHFLGRVANASDIVTFHRRARMPATSNETAGNCPGTRGMTGMPLNGESAIIATSDTTSDPWASISVLDLAQYLLLQSQLHMGIVPDWKLADAVDQFVNKSETRAITDQVETWIARLLDSLQRRDRQTEIVDHKELLQEAQRFAQQHARFLGTQAVDRGDAQVEAPATETSIGWRHRALTYLSPTKLRLLESVMHDRLVPLEATDAAHGSMNLSGTCEKDWRFPSQSNQEGAGKDEDSPATELASSSDDRSTSDKQTRCAGVGSTRSRKQSNSDRTRRHPKRGQWTAPGTNRLRSRPSRRTE